MPASAERVTQDRPAQLAPDSPFIADVLLLIQEAFAEQVGRIDPPSSMHRLTQDDIRAQCAEGRLWTLGTPPRACVILTQKGPRLILGKLAVGAAWRGHGYGRVMVELASQQAARLGCAELELSVRVELVETHAFYRHLGFSKTGETAHAGFDRPTSITMGKPISRPGSCAG